MKVKVIRPHLGANSKMIEVGDVLTVNEQRAREMERGGLALPLVAGGLKERLGGVADKSGPRPTQTRRPGGQIGAAKHASSSRAVRLLAM